MRTRLTLLAIALSSAATLADPCGMVPPAWSGDGLPLTRVGVQHTYAFHRNGVQCIALQPAFEGRVDEFGMLIPFPSPPEIAKLSDAIFQHLGAAVDPPEVVVDLRPSIRFGAGSGPAAPGATMRNREGLQFDSVEVLREEAVGMYEVAVLEAGSAQALGRWMEQHGYRYPDGMDDVCNDYVADGWCFVAVKARVASGPAVEAQPGQRAVDPRLPAGAQFSGEVQAMSFRFHSEELVVPMRLSAFNPGELHNVVYVLSDEPLAIQGLAHMLVVRQLPGEELFAHLSRPLPLRILGGTIEQLSEQRIAQLAGQRDPDSRNGRARDLFVSDLMAARSGVLLSELERREKELYTLGEELGLRGEAYEALVVEELGAARDEAAAEALGELEGMTLTVIDGLFPRSHLAAQNLSFERYAMPSSGNTPESYDAMHGGPQPQREGTLFRGAAPIDLGRAAGRAAGRDGWGAALAALAVGALACFALRRRALVRIACAGLVLVSGAGSLLADPCGMVPPVWTGDGPPLARVGKQRTYVFYSDGIESVALRPAFSGRVEEFGMLIPFPSPPEIQKAPEEIFTHLAAAVDPPEIVVDLRHFRGRPEASGPSSPMPMSAADGRALEFSAVRVISEEAIGMYEVAVLEAGSAAALNRWMTEHGYRYPDGMDATCAEYIDEGWCFVAVKARVGSGPASEAQPGQRSVDPSLPEGASFDGSVQAMSFRFASDELVVPMRLSAFNEGELDNQLYVLTDEPVRCSQLTNLLVVRQLAGEDLYHNLLRPLPVRVIGGTWEDLTEGQRQSLNIRREPGARNGHARDLIAADLLAARNGVLLSELELRRKRLVEVGEQLGLRGDSYDVLLSEALEDDELEQAAEALGALEGLTLTVFDGLFPRSVLAAQNLRFEPWQMPAERNSAAHYDAKLMGPAPQAAGSVQRGASHGGWWGGAPYLAGLGLVLFVLHRSRRRARIHG